MLTSRRLLNCPRSRAFTEEGSARSGNVGGDFKWALSSAFFVLRECFEVNNAVSSGEYTGGRDFSMVGMICGAGGVLWSLSKGYQKG